MTCSYRLRENDSIPWVNFTVHPFSSEWKSEFHTHFSLSLRPTKSCENDMWNSLFHSLENGWTVKFTVTTSDFHGLFFSQWLQLAHFYRMECRQNTVLEHNHWVDDALAKCWTCLGYLSFGQPIWPLHKGSGLQLSSTIASKMSPDEDWVPYRDRWSKNHHKIKKRECSR